MATDEVPKIQGASVTRTTTFMKFHNVMYCNLYTLQAISLTCDCSRIRFPLIIRQMRRPNPAHRQIQGAWGARAPPRAFEMYSFFLSYFLVGVRVFPNWLIDSCISREMSECVVSISLPRANRVGFWRWDTKNFCYYPPPPH